MEPITRKEMYLAKMSGDYSGTVPEPVTRMDYYMAYAAGTYSGPLPHPIVQQEFYWAYICGATDIDLPEPVTRIDMYLGAICGGMILLPEPITREEIYLSKIAKQSEAVVKSAEGKTIVLTDSLDAPFEDFRIYGHTTQETTTGAQLFDASKIPSKTESNVILTNNGDGSFTIKDSEEGSTGAFSAYYTYSVEESIKLFPAGTYKISFDDVLPYYYIHAVNKADGAVISHAESQNRKSATTITDEMVESENYRIRIGFYKPNVTDTTNKTVWPIVQKGTEVPTEWETFTGGKPSPNPDYPQELVGAGDKGSIEVVVTGKNLYNKDRDYSAKGETNPFLGNDIATSQNTNIQVPISLDVENFIGQSVSVSFDIRADVNKTITVYQYQNSGLTIQGSANIAIGNDWTHCSYTGVVADCPVIFNNYGRLIFYNEELNNNNLQIKNLQIELGTEATEYEPYRTTQSLTLSTPNGLPGIPVTSGGNYTDENGKQWVCDEVDFGRGVYVQRVLKSVFDGSNDEGWTIYDNPSCFGFCSVNGLPFNANRRSGYCNQLRVDTIGKEIDNGLWIGVSENKYIYAIRNSFYDDTNDYKGLEKWTEHLAEQPLIVMTYLDNPIETPISANELAVYRALHTNTPTTTITNDEDCWMEVSYKTKPISQYSEAMTLEYLKGE